MRATLVSAKPIYYFSAGQLALLGRDQLLIVNTAERIVTLQKASHQLQGQGRFPDATLRTLVVLLLAQGKPVAYSGLCAALSCPMAHIEALLDAGSLEAHPFQQEAARWQTRMTTLSGATKLMPIWRVRQAITGRGGLNQLLARYGFSWRARNRFGTGYILGEAGAPEEAEEQ